MNLSTFADLLRRTACVAVLLAAACPVRAQQRIPLRSIRGHLYGDLMLQDSVPVCAMLESGIPFPLIDSALVWEHPGLFRPEKLDEPVRVRMAAGFSLVCRYKLPRGLAAGGARSLGDTYVSDLTGRDAQFIWPLQTFTTDSLDRPGMFGLDLLHKSLHLLGGEHLPGEGDGWRVFGLRRDERTGMYRVDAKVAFTDDDGDTHAERLELIVDLGNATLLALFTSKAPVREFVGRSGIPVERVKSHRGADFDVLLPELTTFMDAYSFRRKLVVLLGRPTRLAGAGFLGVPFFERFRVVFDFRDSRLWLAPCDAR